MPDDTELLKKLSDGMIELNASLKPIVAMVEKHEIILFGDKGDDGLTYDAKELKKWKERQEKQSEEHRRDLKSLLFPFVIDFIKLVGFSLFTLAAASKLGLVH